MLSPTRREAVDGIVKLGCDGIAPAQELAGELIHWQHDVFEIHWFRRFAWFGKGKVQFLLNLDGKPAEFRMDVPNEDLWFDELEFKRKPDQAE